MHRFLRLLALVGQRIGLEPVLSVHEVLFAEHVDRPQIERHAAEDLSLLQTFGHRDFDRAVERHLADADLLENVDRRHERKVGIQQRPAKAAARDLDLLGQRNFLMPREQRDLAHLRQVHADRVIDLAIADVFFDLWLELLQIGRTDRRDVIVLDDVQAVLFQQHQQVIQLLGIDRFVREVSVDLRVSQAAAFASFRDQLHQGFVELMHRQFLRVRWVSARLGEL